MSRPPNRLRENIDVERVTPRRAITLLIHGLLPPDDAENFQPANLTVDVIIRMLRHANEVRNRSVTLPQVEKYARDMTEGRWLWTGAPIQIDPDGYVRNGQHRLLAVVLSRTTQDFVVVRNVDPAAQLVMDIGRPRSVSAQMQLQGVSNAPVMTAVANTLLRWRAGKVMQSSYIPSVIEVQELIAKENDALGDASTFINKTRYAMKSMPHAALGATYVEATHLDVQARDEFFDSFLTGADLTVDSPILTLRRKLTTQVSRDLRVRRAGKLYLIVHAWNLWRKNEPSRLLRVPNTLTSETFPRMN